LINYRKGGTRINNDKNTSISYFKKIVKEFSEQRDWDQFHNAKELTTGIVTESSELLQHFRFKSYQQVDDMFDDPKLREEISEEISDVLFFLIRLAQKYDIDLTTEFNNKMSKNKKKYPIDKVKGSNKRHSEY